MHRPKGFLYCTGVKDAEGNPVPLEVAVRRGWIRPGEVPDGFTLPAGAVPVGSNIFVDAGRQYAAYALAFRAPAQNFTLQRFGVGTGTTPPASTDTALVNPVAFSNGSYTKLIDFVDFPVPFVLRVHFTIGAGDCNGYLLSEIGLFAGDETMLARVVRPAINKTSDYAPSLCHELRF